MNNNIFIALLISSLAGLSTFIGGLIVFKDFKDKDGFISFALSFSLSVMISISIFDLIPESFKTLIINYGFITSLIISIIAFILGMLLVSKVSCKLDVKGEGSNLYKVGLLSMVALMIHNFPEGIATFMSAYNDLSTGISLGIAIMLHNIPEGISISVPIYYSTKKRSRGLIYALISGLAEPFGALMAYILLKNFISDISISIVLIFVAGIMISLSINEMLVEALKYNKRKQMNIGLILGLILVIINVLVF